MLIALEILPLSFGVALNLINLVKTSEKGNVWICIIAVAKVKYAVVGLNKSEHGVGKLVYLMGLFKLFEIMKTKQFVQELKAAGCRLVRHGGGHDIWISPITGLMDSVPRHGSQELQKGMERRLRRRLLGQ